MPKVHFRGKQLDDMEAFKGSGEDAYEVAENTKLLAAATRNKIPIRFGCAACRCGTCAVAVDTTSAELKPMGADEEDLLARMKLKTDGSVRLACQARVLSGSVGVDLDFQNTYSPDQGLVDDDH